MHPKKILEFVIARVVAVNRCTAKRALAVRGHSVLIYISALVHLDIHDFRLYQCCLAILPKRIAYEAPTRDSRSTDGPQTHDETRTKPCVKNFSTG